MPKNLQEIIECLLSGKVPDKKDISYLQRSIKSLLLYPKRFEAFKEGLTKIQQSLEEDAANVEQDAKNCKVLDPTLTKEKELEVRNILIGMAKSDRRCAKLIQELKATI
jgi:hypothetical protein